MDPKKLSIADFSYSLPEDRIAKYPLTERDASKLLIFQQGVIAGDVYKNLDRYIPENTLLVFNNTKVIEARLQFRKSTGGVVEIFCLYPGGEYKNLESAMSQRSTVDWHCMIGGASKWKHGQVLEKKFNLDNKSVSLFAVYKEKTPESFLIQFRWTDESLSFVEVLHHAGAIPLPPYLKREPEISDDERYQTIYASQEGSVAAPTAGLHFTREVLDNLSKKNTDFEFLTLHVGAGTFKPVKSATMADHSMHVELITVSKATIQRLQDHLYDNIVAVGTTSLRTLESLYWAGVKLSGTEDVDLSIGQWEPYEQSASSITPADSLRALLAYLEKKELQNLELQTKLMVAPPYQVRMANGLITNFHQPQSTLLLLVAALVGNDWKKIYAYALEHGFRFLSYGDGSLLWFNRSKQERGPERPGVVISSKEVQS